MKVEIVYHPRWDDPLDPLALPEATIGLKVTVGQEQFGNWRPLPEEHSVEQALLALADCAMAICSGDVVGPLEALRSADLRRLLDHVAKAME